MLKHTTITITRDQLVKLSPCGNGLANIDMLNMWPLRLATDPEKNIDLAVALCSTDRGARDIAWFAEVVAGLFDRELTERDAYDAAGNFIGMFCYYREDVMLAQQHIAVIADALARKAGR